MIPADYWGGRELIVTYIFGDMLPQKCNLHFLICLDKCNLLFWGTIQEILHLKPENCKLHFWGNIRNCNLHFWGVWLCGTNFDAQQFPAHHISFTSIIQHTQINTYSGTPTYNILQLIWFLYTIGCSFPALGSSDGNGCSCRVPLTLLQDPKTPQESQLSNAKLPFVGVCWEQQQWWNLMMCHLAFFLIKSLGRGCHSDQR